MNRISSALGVLLISSAVAHASANLSVFEFGAQLQNRVELLWTTSSETGNRSFKIERSYNGSTWTEIGSKQGAGDTSTPINYTFRDAQPYPGVNYYRLRMVDVSGVSTYSQTLTVDLNPAECGFYIYPNPATTYLLVNWDGCDVEHWTIKIYKSTGELLLTNDYTYTTTGTIDISALPNDTYFVLVEAKKGTGRMTKMIRKG